jgi:AbrB family looped-hinge helix DNA binding protein
MEICPQGIYKAYEVFIMMERKLISVVKTWQQAESVAITIPHEIREKMGIVAGTLIKVYMEGNKITLEVVK